MKPRAVIVFARSPERGQVKTRLAAAVGEDAALALHRAFLHDALAAARLAGAAVVLAHTPAPDFPERALADVAFEQRGATFGERFDHAFAEAARRLPPGAQIVLVGADTPHLSPGLLRRALVALNGSRAVIGPSREGGFYLLGFNAPPVPVAAAFDDGNESAALARLLRASGIEPQIIETSFDVDLPSDLVDLVLHLELLEAAGATWTAPETRRALREEGIEASPRKAPEATRGRVIARRGAPASDPSRSDEPPPRT